MKRMISLVRATCCAAAFLALPACGDNNPGTGPQVEDDAGDLVPTDAGADAGIDASPDAGTDPDASVAPLMPCLERPDTLPRPPTGALSCDLLPPSFAP